MTPNRFDVVYDNGEVMVTIPDKFNNDFRARTAMLFANSEVLLQKAIRLQETYQSSSFHTTARALEEFCDYVAVLTYKVYSAQRKENEREQHAKAALEQARVDAKREEQRRKRADRALQRKKL